MIFVTFLWRGQRFAARHEVPVYGPQHVAALASMLRRHGGHELVCVSDDREAARPAAHWIALPLAAKMLRGFYPKLWAWSQDLGDVIGERFVLIDLDCVVLGDISEVLDPNADLILWDYARAEPYNTSLVAMEPGCRFEVWDRFSPAEADRTAAAAGRWTGDQSWVAHVLGPAEVTVGQEDGIWCYRPNRDRMAPQPGARVMFFCGPFLPDIEAQHSAWLKEAYR